MIVLNVYFKNLKTNSPKVSNKRKEAFDKNMNHLLAKTETEQCDELPDSEEKNKRQIITHHKNNT